jgi:hypothetical protein
MSKTRERLRPQAMLPRVIALEWKLRALAVGALLLGSCVAQDRTETVTGEKEQEVVRGPDGGWVMECNGYADGGLYNYCTWNCHHAAGCGLDAGNDGVISCDGTGPGSPYGHAVNWDTVPCADGGASCVGYCVGEPQRPGSTACCWEQSGGGAINISSGGGLACANQICGRDGGQTAFEAGVGFDTRPCVDIHGQGEACRNCCSARATFSWCKGDAACIADMQRYLDACNAACDGDAGASDAGAAPGPEGGAAPGPDAGPPPAPEDGATPAPGDASTAFDAW